MQLGAAGEGGLPDVVPGAELYEAPAPAALYLVPVSSLARMCIGLDAFIVHFAFVEGPADRLLSQGIGPFSDVSS